MAMTLLNNESAALILKQQMNKEMVSAAEPLIAAALVDIEATMRKKLGSMVISYLDNYMQVDRYGTDLRIIIKHDHN